MGKIKLVRIYDHEQPEGYRILVDRLWPRGVSKVKANLNDWTKNIAPSTDLRKWFNHDDSKYPEFEKKYIQEIKANSDTPAFLAKVKDELKNQDVLFLYGSKNRTHNEAVVLKDYVEGH